MIKFLGKVIERKIESLEEERDFLKKGKGACWPGTFKYECYVLSVAVQDLKIAIWRALIGEKDE